MNHYRVFLRGENFLLSVDHQPARLGFYTTRFVRAETSEKAGFVAVDLIRKDKTLSGVLNQRDDPPVVFADEVDRVYPSNTRKQVKGFTFFPMETQKKARRRRTGR